MLKLNTQVAKESAELWKQEIKYWQMQITARQEAKIMFRPIKTSSGYIPHREVTPPSPELSGLEAEWATIRDRVDPNWWDWDNDSLDYTII